MSVRFWQNWFRWSKKSPEAMNAIVSKLQVSRTEWPAPNLQSLPRNVVFRFVFTKKAGEINPMDRSIIDDLIVGLSDRMDRAGFVGPILVLHADDVITPRLFNKWIEQRLQYPWECKVVRAEDEVSVEGNAAIFQRMNELIPHQRPGKLPPPPPGGTGKSDHGSAPVAKRGWYMDFDASAHAHYFNGSESLCGAEGTRWGRIPDNWFSVRCAECNLKHGGIGVHCEAKFNPPLPPPDPVGVVTKAMMDEQAEAQAKPYSSKEVSDIVHACHHAQRREEMRAERLKKVIKKISALTVLACSNPEPAESLIQQICRLTMEALHSDDTDPWCGIDYAAPGTTDRSVLVAVKVLEDAAELIDRNRRVEARIGSDKWIDDPEMVEMAAKLRAFMKPSP